MYYIYQNSSNNEAIIGMLENKNKFMAEIINLNNDIEVIYNKNVDDIKNNGNYNGVYLLLTSNMAQLVSKVSYAHDSHDINYVHVLITWKLLPFISDRTVALQIPETENKDNISSDGSLDDKSSDTVSMGDVLSNNKEDEEDEEDGEDIVKQFDLSETYHHSKNLIVGRRGTGKTTLISNILDKYINDCPNGEIVVCSTMDLHKSFYSTKYPKATLYQTYDDTLFKQYLGDNNDNILFIFDDCIKNYHKMEKYVALSKLMLKDNISIIVTACPYNDDIPNKFNNVFLFYECFYVNQKRLYSQFGSIFPSFNLFKKNFLKLTQDFGCVVFTKSDVYYYKAIVN